MEALPARAGRGWGGSGAAARAPRASSMALNAAGNDDGNWEPPSEAELKTILLQDKQRKLYCVACQELNSDIDKDNPALNAQAALSQVREHQLASTSEEAAPLGYLPAAHQQPHVPRPEHCEGAASGLRAAATAAAIPQARPAPTPALPASPLAAAEDAILQKLGWASQELQHSASIELSLQLCSLIRSCAESLKCLKELTPQ
ncbi:protein ZNRD2 isoform X2 [Lepidochelys kempii]|uniref:protein ZNRD2 isoform X2 n=1 Tax=Lepidochelys kempii TaxID=8472 RepID=UPI003C6EEAF6